MRGPIEWDYRGLCAYDEGLLRQQACWDACRASGPDVILALEHPPTVTLGRHATHADLTVSQATLAARGVACVRTDRGGRATYHGPGQLVLYPIMNLGARGFGVATFVWALEQVLLEIAVAFGVAARRDAHGRGVWSARGKLGAVGIRVRHGISTHGVALNVTTDLASYRMIVPCGTRNLPVTSLAHEGAPAVSVVAAAAVAEVVCARVLQAPPAGAPAEEARL
jgi:lipoate-protein ligase B